MLPVGGKFRVVDFTIGNSFTSGARTTIIYSNQNDDLENYVDRYGPFGEMKFPPIRVVIREYSDIKVCYNLILESNTEYYIIYNGDNPSIIDFTQIVKKYKGKRTGAVLFRLIMDDRPTMAYTVLVSDQKTLLSVIRSAIREKRSAPNLFEMIINILVNQGIGKSSFNALYWPIKNVPEYYELNREIVFNPGISGKLFREKVIQSKILAEDFAHVGRNGKIRHSFISDSCRINGTVENSIIFPGVEIGDQTLVSDSIILPYNRIGAGSRIVKTIIDERTDMNPENRYLNIGDSVRIGSGEDFIKNGDFPLSLFDSVTLIGKDCRIPGGVRIGGGCYAGPGMGEESFAAKKILYDGSSLVRQFAGPDARR